jgi:hypothetical protein
MLGDVKPATIGPIIQETISKGTVISTDEYVISAQGLRIDFALEILTL